MINRIKSYIFHPLFFGSAVMIFGSNIANFIAYIYHLVVGRMLGPANYGELSSIISLLGLFFTSFNFLGLVIVKFVSSSKDSEHKKIFRWFNKKAFQIAATLFVLLILISPLLSGFLRIDIKTILLLAPIIFIGVHAYVYRSFLQGLLRFKDVVLSINLDFMVRLLVGALLIYLGFSVFGATLGILISTFYAYSFLKSKVSIFNKGSNEGKFVLGKKVLSYAIPIFITTISVNSMISMDLILVKHFFNSHDAGIYASLSTLSKIIFYGAGPVAGVMFPLISKKRAKGENYTNIFVLSLLLASGIALGVLLIYLVLPELSIKILFGEEFLEGSRDLIYFGCYMAIFSLVNLFVNMFMSIEKTKVSYFVLIAAISQAVSIWFYHGSIGQVIRVSTIVSGVLLMFLIYYFMQTQRYEEKRK